MIGCDAHKTFYTVDS